MNEKKIQKLIELVEKSNIDGLEVSRWGTKVKITKNSPPIVSAPAAVAPAPTAAKSALEIQTPSAPPAQSETPAVMPATDKPAQSNLVEIKSPMVGTFYRAPAPDADPYVKTGDNVNVGQVLCIIEAMKLMNEIEAEVHGKVIDILVENGKPVEYNQVLFLVEAAK
jgi:acetyl-CoA carboxylase biotin carboxyl carrier protein